MAHQRIASLGFALLVVAAGITACPPPSDSPQERARASSFAASSGASSEALAAGAVPSAATCPGDAPVVCPAGCCPAGSTCAPAGLTDGGECLTPPVTACPASAPVQCGGGPSCDGGICTLVDQSSFHNDALLQLPAAFADGRASGSVRFSAEPCLVDGVSAPAAGLPADGGAFSLEAWVRSSLDPLAVVGFTNGSDLVSLGFASNGFALGLFGYGATGSPGCGMTVSASLNDGQWHFVAGVFQAGNATLYVDGVSKGTCAAGLLKVPAGARVVMGSPAPRCWPSGQLDEVRVVAGALTAAQVAQDFAAPHLPLTADTFGLWLFDDAAPARCCPTGSGCDPSGRCTASSSGAPACPGSAPVACTNGTCCPTGTRCTAAGCVKDGTAPVCPTGWPGYLPCSDGTCCPTGLACAPGGHCTATNGLSPAVAICAPGTTDVETDLGHACCPDTAGVTMMGTSSTYSSCLGNPAAICAVAGWSPPSCPAGTSACMTSSPGSCIRPATPTPCPSGVSCAMTALSTLCCPNATDTCGASRCCAPGTQACLTGPACCPNRQCNAAGTACDVIADPTVCADGSPICGGLCCPSGAACSGGLCVAATPAPLFCANGTVCGGVCCPGGTACLAPGQCGTPPSTPVCGAGFSGACSAAGPCCKDGYACKGTIGSGGISCLFTGPHVPHGGAEGPACGSGFCAGGLACSGEVCCGPDFPDACGASCCLSGAGCGGASGSCGCPLNLPVQCGTQCCAAGMACVQGSCVAGCPGPWGPAVPACGTSCCASGSACVEGECTCPDGYPVSCGDSCCLPGGTCARGACGCPPGRASCGALCCGDTQICQGGSCIQKPEETGGGGTCSVSFEECCSGGASLCGVPPATCDDCPTGTRKGIICAAGSPCNKSGGISAGSRLCHCQ